MRKIKEYLKLIFAAIVCFFMKLVPKKRREKKAMSEVSWNPMSESEENGADKSIGNIDEAVKSEMCRSFGVLLKEWQYHRDKKFKKEDKSFQIYHNTG